MNRTDGCFDEKSSLSISFFESVISSMKYWSYERFPEKAMSRLGKISSQYEIPSEPTKKSKNHGNIKWVLRVGVTQSGCWVVEKTLILQGFLALTIWKNQRKSLVDTKLIPPLSRDRIIQKSLKARKFVFLKTNLRAFFTVILRILWNTMKRGANKNFSKIFVDTVDFYPLKFRISERTWNLITI